MIKLVQVDEAQWVFGNIPTNDIINVYNTHPLRYNQLQYVNDIPLQLQSDT